MVNKVLNSISKALYTEFGESYHYYVEDVEQATKLPCFHISVLSPLSRSVNRKDYYRTMPCVLHYFSDDKVTTNNNCYSIGERALECLEYLNLDGQLVRSEDMSFTMVDDVLQIFLTYRFWTEKVEDLDQMETLDSTEVSTKTT